MMAESASKIFGKNIRRLREARRLSQAEVATEFGIARNTIIRWESGAALPATQDISKVAKYFEVHEYELFVPEGFAIVPITPVAAQHLSRPMTPVEFQAMFKAEWARAEKDMVAKTVEITKDLHDLLQKIEREKADLAELIKTKNGAPPDAADPK